MKRQRKSHEERKDEIIRGALELAGETGVKEVTAQAIADRVGIAQPTIFRHFKTRDAIFRGAMEWIANMLFGVLEGFDDTGEPADARLRKLIQRQLTLVSKQRGIPRLLLSDRLHLEDAALKQTVRRIMARYTAYLESILRDGVESGRFRAELDTQATARWIAAIVQGLIMRWSIHDFGFNLEDQAPELWRFLEPALMEPRRES
ncbi:MAG TPA: TetR family transcriptional regulator [Thiohalobacter sp.]|nr:TetR family transcriptional regulator [Thiohalobacter sp.]